MTRRGDIYLLPFPFTDLGSAKVRPALVVSSDTFNSRNEDAVFMFITSKKYTTSFDIRIEARDPAFSQTGLKGPSTFRVGKLACLEQRLTRRRLGTVESELMSKIDAALQCLFDIPFRPRKSTKI